MENGSVLMIWNIGKEKLSLLKMEKKDVSKKMENGYV